MSWTVTAVAKKFPQEKKSGGVGCVVITSALSVMQRKRCELDHRTSILGKSQNLGHNKPQCCLAIFADLFTLKM